MDIHMKTLEELNGYIRAAWSRETSADGKNWSPKNAAWGQDVATVLLVEHCFHGLIMRFEIQSALDPKIAALRTHYYNCIGGEDVDVTKTQFGDAATYETLKARGQKSAWLRERLLENAGAQKRYALLHAAVLRLHRKEVTLN